MKATLPSIFIGLLIGTAIAMFINHNPRDVAAEGMPVESNQPNIPNFTKLSENLRPTVVNIVATRKKRHTSIFSNPFYSLDKATGSGVFIDDQGHIATNNHVIEEAHELIVTLHDGKQVTATLVGRDVRTDLAVLKIKGDLKYKFAKFAPTEPQVGSWVIAIGSPLGFRHTVTQGIVSAVGRRQTQSSRSVFGYANFVQTSAAINPGNSGGPLINMNGEIAGINTAIASKTGGFQGIGLAIPSTLSRKICNDIIENGYVPYVWVGAVLAEFNELNVKYLDMIGVNKDSTGIVILETIQNTPSTRSDLREDDIVVKFNDELILDSAQFRYNLSQKRPGEKVSFDLLRKGKTVKVNMVLEERPESIRDSIVYENRKKKVVD